MIGNLLGDDCHCSDSLKFGFSFTVAAKAKDAAEILKLTAPDLLEIGVIDEIVPEPDGGAHRNPDKAAEIIKERILVHLKELQNLNPEEIVNQRINKFGKMGFFKE